MNRLLVFALLVCQGMSAQAVVFLEIGDTLQKPKYQEFNYLNDKTDISDAVKVGKLKAVGSQENPVLLYNLIKKEAQKVGANAFKFVQIDKYPDQTAELTLDVFYADEAILGDNFGQIDKNNVYIFGDRNLLEAKTQSCKVDGKKYELQSGHFLKFPVLPGETLKIGKGAIAGTILTVEGKTGKPSKFYSLKGLEISGGDGGIDHVGVNISGGDIIAVEQNLALLLLKIFEEQK